MVFQHFSFPNGLIFRKFNPNLGRKNSKKKKLIETAMYYLERVKIADQG